MGRKHILLLDQDLVSLKVSDTNLRRHGYLVYTSSSGRDALKRMRYARPDVIICDVQLRDQSGFDFRNSLVAEPGLADLPFMFTAERSSTEAKVRALQLGVEIFLVKPLYTSELLSRIQLVLSQRESEALEKTKGRTIQGALAERSLADLISMAHKHQHSCSITLNRDQDAGRLYFHRGDLVDAEYGELVGERALFRLLTWREGKYDIRFKLTVREPTIQKGTDTLLLEGLNRADEWHAVMEQLPDLNQVYEIAFNELRKSLNELPAELNPLIKLFDGRLTLAQIVDLSPFDDLDAMTILSRLHFEGFLAPVATSRGHSMENIRDWLGFAGRDVSRAAEPVPDARNALDQTMAPERVLAERSVQPVPTALIETDQTEPVPDELTSGVDAAPKEKASGPPPIPRPQRPVAPPAATTQVVIPDMRIDDTIIDDQTPAALAARMMKGRIAEAISRELSEEAGADSDQHTLGEELLLDNFDHQVRTPAVTPPHVFAPAVAEGYRAPHDAAPPGAAAMITVPEEFVRTDNYEKSSLVEDGGDVAESESAAQKTPSAKLTLDFTPQPAALEHLMGSNASSLSPEQPASKKHNLSRALDAAIETLDGQTAERSGKVIPFNKSGTSSGIAAAAALEPTPEPAPEQTPETETEADPGSSIDDPFFFSDGFRHDSFSDVAPPKRRFRFTKGMALSLLLASVLIGMISYTIYRSTRYIPRKDPLDVEDRESRPGWRSRKPQPGTTPLRPLAPDQPLKTATAKLPGKKPPTNVVAKLTPKPVSPTAKSPGVITTVGKSNPKPTTPGLKTPAPKTQPGVAPLSAKQPKETTPPTTVQVTPPMVRKKTPGVKRKKPAPEKREAAQRLYAAATKAHRAGARQKNRAQLQRAARLYRRVLALDAKHTKARVALSQVYLELKNTKEATRTLQTVTKSNPKNAIAFLSLGATYQRKGNKRAAIGAYRKYLKLAPGGKYAREVRKIVLRLQREL